MSDIYRIQKTTLDSIGDAIRAKTGESGTITPLEMPSKIESISVGGQTSATMLYRYNEVHFLASVPFAHPSATMIMEV